MAARPIGRPWWLAVAIVAAVGGAAWVAGGIVVRQRLAASVPALPPLDGLPLAVQRAVQDAHAEARSAPAAASLGALGRALHAAQLPDGASAAYRVAEALAPADWTWTYLRALLLEERGAPEGRDLLARVTTVAPEFGPAWFRLAEADFKTGRLDDAGAAYARAETAPGIAAFTPEGVTARQTWPLGAYAGVGLARIALERGDHDGARARLRALSERYPGFAPARGLLRQLDRGLAAASGSYVPPADPVVDALVASSRHGDVLLKYAGLATRAGDVAWREFLVRRALSFNPDDRHVLMEMAAMLQTTNRPAEALDYLRQHERLAPGDHHGLVQQGRVLMDLGRLAEAEVVLRRAVAVRDAAGEYNLASVLDRLGRWEEARTHYERALVINPFHARAMNNLGAGLARAGDTAAALEHFERAIDLAPESAETYVNYGGALVAMRRFDDAVRALTTAIVLDPRDANPHNNLGIAFASLGDLPRARDAFARALELNPRHPNARDNLDRVAAMLQSGRP